MIFLQTTDELTGFFSILIGLLAQDTIYVQQIKCASSPSSPYSKEGWAGVHHVPHCIWNCSLWFLVSCNCKVFGYKTSITRCNVWWKGNIVKKKSNPTKQDLSHHFYRNQKYKKIRKSPRNKSKFFVVVVFNGIKFSLLKFFGEKKKKEKLV